MHLPDVSEFQPNVNWAGVVGENGGAAVIRALYGSGHEDALYAQGRRAAARAAGVKALGIYQYIRQDQDVLAQADAFVSLVGRLNEGEFAVMDLEEGSGDQSLRANLWLERVNNTLPAPDGYQGAWLYSGLDFALTHGLSGIFNGTAVHTWVAAYGPAEPSLGHSLWQHSNGQLALCSYEPWQGAGFVDCSYFNGNLTQLLAKIGNSPAPPANTVILEGDMPVQIARSDFDALGGAVPLSLPKAATAVRFYSNHPATLRVDTRGSAGVVNVSLSYGAAQTVPVDAGINAIVVHRDDPSDTGTNTVSVAFDA